MRILVDTSTGQILGSGSKDLVTGYAQPADRSGVVLSSTPTTGKPPRRKVGDHTHDPHRDGGLLNGRKPK
jgi:hypothetical protein